MKSLDNINKLLEWYVVGRPKSRIRKYLGHEIYLISNFGSMEIFALKNNEIYFKKTIYNSWKKAFIYYYNDIELLIKGAKNEKKNFIK